MDGLEQVGGRAEPHQVPGPRIRLQLPDDDLENRFALGGRLVPGQAADADAVERKVGYEAGRLRSENRIETALDDAEESLIRPRMGG